MTETVKSIRTAVAEQFANNRIRGVRIDIQIRVTAIEGIYSSETQLAHAQRQEVVAPAEKNPLAELLGELSNLNGHVLRAACGRLRESFEPLDSLIAEKEAPDV